MLVLVGELGDPALLATLDQPYFGLDSEVQLADADPLRQRPRAKLSLEHSRVP